VRPSPWEGRTPLGKGMGAGTATHGQGKGLKGRPGHAPAGSQQG
jgi:hypothetical protein